MELAINGPHTSERIMAVLPRLIKPKPFRRDTLYAIVITDRRSIFARITDKMLREVMKAQDRVKRRAWRLRLWWADKVETFYNYDRFLTMNPDDILRENSDNFAIENSCILSFVVKPFIPHIIQYDPRNMIEMNMGMEEDDVVHEIPDITRSRPKKEFQEHVEMGWELRIETTKALLSFSVDYDPKVLLKQFFPDKIR